MFSISEVKSTALKSLKGHWLVPCLLTLVIGFIQMALAVPSVMASIQPFLSSWFNYGDSLFDFFGNFDSFDYIPFIEEYEDGYYDSGQWFYSSLLSGVFGIIQFIVTGAISIALSRFFLALIKDPDKTTFSTFFEGLVYWGKGILAVLWVSLWIWLWAALFAGILVVLLIIAALAGIAQGVSITAFMDEPSFAMTGLYALFAIALILWAIAYFVVLINRTYAYSQIFFVQSEYPKVSVTKALKASIAMTKGARGKLLLLDLSFTGWALLACLTLGIGNIWLAPYTGASHAAAYARLKQIAFEKGLFITAARPEQPQAEQPRPEQLPPQNGENA
jgi:uncharacterized membrane protein